MGCALRYTKSVGIEAVLPVCALRATKIVSRLFCRQLSISGSRIRAARSALSSSRQINPCPPVHKTLFL